MKPIEQSIEDQLIVDIKCFDVRSQGDIGASTVADPEVEGGLALLGVLQLFQKALPPVPRTAAP